MYFFIVSLLMLAITTFVIPESPYWLILKGHINEATEILRSIRDNEDIVQEELLDIERYTQNNENVYKKGNVCCGQKIIALFAAYKQLAILIIFGGLHKLSVSVPFTQYTVIFFKELDVPFDVKLATMIHSVVGFCSTFALPYFVLSYDNKTLLFATSVAAGFGMSVTLLYEYIFYNNPEKPCFWVTLLGIYLYDMVTTIGITSVIVMLPGELFRIEISGIASAVFNIISSIIASIVSKMFLALLSEIGLLWILWTYAVCSIFSAYLSIVILPETKGKSLSEIQRIYFIDESKPLSLPSTPSAPSSLPSLKKSHIINNI